MNIRINEVDVRAYKLKEGGLSGISEILIRGTKNGNVARVRYFVDGPSGQILSQSPSPMPSMFREIHGGLRELGHMRKVEIPSLLVKITTGWRETTFPKRFFSQEFLKSIPHIDDL